MKKCIKCKIEKPEQDFPITDKKGRRKNTCKICFNSYRRKLHKEIPSYRKNAKKRKKLYRKKITDENLPKLLEYFKSHPCKACGKTNPIILEFDHIKKKKCQVSYIYSRQPWKNVLKEIKKCQVLCSNCHAIKTSIEQRWNDLEKLKSRKKRKNLPKLMKYLKSHPCVNCGEENPTVLEFDHIRDKKCKISRLMERAAWKTVLKEIKKCQVLCSNCHQIKTAKQFNWSMLKYMNGAKLNPPHSI